MQWLQISFDVDAASSQQLEDALLSIGAVAVTFADNADQPIYEPPPGTAPLWDQTRLSALFDASSDSDEILLQLAENLQTAPPPYRIEILQDKDWTREWMRDFQPMQYGERLWICPSWLEPPDPDAINLILDPGLAFGSGTHATTALCMEWLDSQSMTDKTLLDFGCGSGVLAIAGLLLGASHAVATDIDPQALYATEENARRNHLPSQALSCYLPADLPAGKVDVVLANILAGPLVELADTICNLLLPGGALVLSGILCEQAEVVQQAYAHRIHFTPAATRDGWVRLTGHHNV